MTQFCKRLDFFSHYQMIQYLDIHQRKGFFQGTGNFNVSSAGL